jgi:hypothetical protein
MYTKEETYYDWDGDDICTILDPDGIVICKVLSDEADALLSHLNRGM